MAEWHIISRGHFDDFEYGFYDYGPEIKRTSRGVKVVAKKTWVACTPPPERDTRKWPDDYYVAKRTQEDSRSGAGPSKKRKRSKQDTDGGDALETGKRQLEVKKAKLSLRADDKADQPHEQITEEGLGEMVAATRTKRTSRARGAGAQKSLGTKWTQRRRDC